MKPKNIIIRGAKILGGQFRNFSGEERRYNERGKRNFCVEIPPELVDELKEQGWNISCLDGNANYEEPLYFIRAIVRFDKRPPMVVLVSGKTKTQLDEETIGMLDWADIVEAKVELSPSWYDINGNQGYTAYLRTLYVEIESDPFADDYDFDSDSEEEELPF